MKYFGIGHIPSYLERTHNIWKTELVEMVKVNISPLTVFDLNRVEALIDFLTNGRTDTRCISCDNDPVYRNYSEKLPVSLKPTAWAKCIYNVLR